jgi:hypothetical protein
MTSSMLVQGVPPAITAHADPDLADFPDADSRKNFAHSGGNAGRSACGNEGLLAVLARDDGERTQEGA